MCKQRLWCNWDQTAIQLVLTGDWTMNEGKAKKIVIVNSDDKLQTTAILAATARWLVNICLYNSSTKERQRAESVISWCLGCVAFRKPLIQWGHNGKVQKEIIIPERSIEPPKEHPALTIIDCFKGQTTLLYTFCMLGFDVFGWFWEHAIRQICKDESVSNDFPQYAPQHAIQFIQFIIVPLILQSIFCN